MTRFYSKPAAWPTEVFFWPLATGASDGNQRNQMTTSNPYFSGPMSMHRPRYTETSTKTKIAAAQTYSTNVRKAPITLPVPDWEKDEQMEDRA